MSSIGHASKESYRHLARIVRIDEILPHPNADKLCIASVGGWQVCIKLDEFKKGDLALYMEIDSLVPTNVPEFAFLEERKEGLKSINDITYSRIKTIKLRGELSQGLLAPIPAVVAGITGRVMTEGIDLTEALGVLKYEKTSDKSKEVVEKNLSWYHRLALKLFGEIDPVLAWPSFLNKSAEERVQNTGAQYAAAVESGELFEKTVKLDGESMTVYCVEDPTTADGIRTGVCSRNAEIRQHDIVYSWPRAIVRWIGALMLRNRRAISYRPVEKDGKPKLTFNFGIPKFVKVNKADSYFLEFVKKNRLMDIVAQWTDWANSDDCISTYAIQGELIGPGIQSNYEGVPELRFCVYRVYRIRDGKPLEELKPADARKVCEGLRVDYIPVLEESTVLPATIKDALKDAEGKRFFSKEPRREGVVYKSLTRNYSFKVISNGYLLKEE